MSIGDFFRKVFGGPTRIGDGSGEEAVALQEDYGAPNEGEAELKRTEELSGGAVMPGWAASEGAAAAEEDLASEEAPPDPDP